MNTRRRRTAAPAPQPGPDGWVVDPDPWADKPRSEWPESAQAYAEPPFVLVKDADDAPDDAPARETVAIDIPAWLLDSAIPTAPRELIPLALRSAAECQIGAFDVAESGEWIVRETGIAWRPAVTGAQLVLTGA